MIRKATINDKNKVCNIYKLAKESMKSNGIDQWQDGYPNEESFLNDCENGISIVVTDEEDGVIATAAAYIGHEATYDEIDGRWLSDNDTYGIIHRIAVSPESKKRGTASSVVEYTEKLCREKGISSMRCDTHKDNHIMQGMLKKNGYEYCGVIIIEDGTERVAFEKILK